MLPINHLVLSRTSRTDPYATVVNDSFQEAISVAYLIHSSRSERPPLGGLSVVQSNGLDQAAAILAFSTSR